jgi:hypothetical protein
MRDWTGSRIQADALTVMCPDCHAPIGALCVNTITGSDLRGFPAHIRRITKHQESENSSE